MSKQKMVRHIVSLSGGKDSTALAIYLRDKIENLEYVFCDTGEELPETYEYLDKLEAFLGKEIKRLKSRYSFDDLLKKHSGFLPSPQARWCTQELKIKPFEEYVGDDICHSYIGIRADEVHRKGYISKKPNIIAHYPFIEAGIKKEDVMRILAESGVGFPEYYQWRSRSGCYFCFFQQKNEWIGLLRNHPDLYKKAQNYEKKDEKTGKLFTWSSSESLEEIAIPERIKEIERDFYRKQSERGKIIQEGFSFDLGCNQDANGCGDENGCLVCHL